MPARKKKETPAAERTEAQAPKERKPKEHTDEQKKALALIRKLYEQQGLGFPSIAKHLTEKGIPTFGSGSQWHAPVVRGIVLRNGWKKGEKKHTGAAE